MIVCGKEGYSYEGSDRDLVKCMPTCRPPVCTPFFLGKDLQSITSGTYRKYPGSYSFLLSCEYSSVRDFNYFTSRYLSDKTKTLVGNRFR